MVAQAMRRYEIYRAATASANEITLSVSTSLSEGNLKNAITTPNAEAGRSYDLLYALATVITEQVESDDISHVSISEREKVRGKLLRAGALVTITPISREIPDLSPEEILRIGQLPDGARSSEDVLDDIRGES